MLQLAANPLRISIFSLLPAEIDQTVRAWGWPAFRGKQLRQWVYEKGVTDPEGMSNLSKDDRALLGERMGLGESEIVHHQTSDDGTQKLLLRWPDGAQAETVMIPDGERRTACVSSQVGCPVGCKFCASGLNGVKGNLSAGQIVEQTVSLNCLLRPSGKRITNVVFMGMGEPMANYNNLMQAIRIMHDPQCLNLGARRITISTVGVPARMRQLATEDLPVNLAISLHAPNEPLRRQLIPWAEHFALEDILQAARDYFKSSGREVTLEYILLSGVNDRPEQARELATLCRTLRANVNLIRYNQVEGLPFTRPKSNDVVAFQEILRSAGVNAHVRKSRGRDIDAACGQLKRKSEEGAAGNPQSPEEKEHDVFQPPPAKAHPCASGFTLIELLVLLGIVLVLAGIFVPFLSASREQANRAQCANNLMRLWESLSAYANDNGKNLPRVVYDVKGHPSSYTAYTGPDSNPFAPHSEVQPNDVTASLWLLVSHKYLKSPKWFICPSSGGYPDPMTDARGKEIGRLARGNFRSRWNLSYAYASPFSSAPGYELNTDKLPPDFALLADQGAGGLRNMPIASAPPFALAKANSRNHNQAGQNVLYAAGYVKFQNTPYCGNQKDNIYTALWPTPLKKGQSPPPDAPGYRGPDIGPSYFADSYLVPGDDGK
jgi:23S rRNA (adenine2503-C2)-methyltransferase